MSSQPAPSLIDLSSALAERLAHLEASPVEVVAIEPLVGVRAPTELKRMGYGVPLLVRYLYAGSLRQVVFRTQAPNWFGHDRRSDRACLSLLAADTYSDQPRHIAVRDVGALRGPELVSLRATGELYLITDYVEGSLYANDLRAVDERGEATLLDLARARALAAHLADLHAEPPPEAAPQIYTRAIRDLLGSGEGIFGIVDSYPDDFVDRSLLRRIEELALAWRWRLGREEVHRLRRTHGDFHPYNLLFRELLDFTVLDASRGGAGDPADDLAAMSINYFFGGLRKPDAWALGPGQLWRAFFDEYTRRSGASSALDNMPPFLAWRSLVLASPAWYPDISAPVRHALLTRAIAWLERGFDPGTVDVALFELDAAQDSAISRPPVGGVHGQALK